MKFLLIKLNHLGDTLLLTPTLRFLAQRFPGAAMDVLVRGGCEVMLQGHPAIRHLLALGRPDRERRPWRTVWAENRRAWQALAGQRYDYAFALSVSDRACLWAWLSRARVRVANDAYGEWGWRRRLFHQLSPFAWAPHHQVLKDFRTVADCFDPQAQPGPLEFFPGVPPAAFAQRFPGLDQGPPLAVIHVTSRWRFKQWLPERWAAVADALQEQHGLRVAFTAGPGPVEAADVQQILSRMQRPALNLAGRTTMAELACLLGRARLFLGVDTVAMHLAAAMQTPIVALFGPSSETSWRPWQCPHELVLGECPCKVTRQFVCDKSRPYPCMERIQVPAVLAAAARLLQTPAAKAPLQGEGR
ncbi:MAG: putative lipopolysaccharide heptosyltransferase III [Verrucomicrobiae bacterium]|nr:putative lipopolysaccharide heptosyltransferase III [Verrucomicrobiae bacterium]